MSRPGAIVVVTLVAAAAPAGSVAGQRSASLASSEARALEALDRFRPPVQFGVYAARAGSDLLVVVEVPAEAVAAGRWRTGADLTALAEDAAGQGAGSAEARLPPSGRAVLRVTPVPRDPIRSVSVRLHTPDDLLVEDAILAAPATLVGDPLIYREGKREQGEPIAILSFSRGAMIRVQWPVLAPLSGSAATLLDATGQPVHKRLTLDRSNPGVLTLGWRVARLPPTDYLIELTTTAGTVSERRYLALRIV